MEFTVGQVSRNMKCLIHNIRDSIFLVLHSNDTTVWIDVPSTRQSMGEKKLLVDYVCVNIGNQVCRQSLWALIVHHY